MGVTNCEIKAVLRLAIHNKGLRKGLIGGEISKVIRRWIIVTLRKDQNTKLARKSTERYPSQEKSEVLPQQDIDWQ